MNKTGKRPLNTYEVAFRLIRYKFGWFTLDAAFWAILWISPIFSGLIVREIFNGLTGDAQYEIGLWGLLALLGGLAAGRVIGLTGGIYSNATFFHNIGGLMRANLLRHIIDRPGADALPGSPGEAISRFRGDVEELNRATEWFIDMPGMVITTIASLGLMFSINPRITLVIFAPMLLIVLIVSMLRTQILAYRESARTAAGRVTGFIAEFFGAVQAVKVAIAERDVIQRFEELNEQRRLASLKDSLLSELMVTTFRSTINIGVGVILLMTGESIRGGSFTIGDFALFIAYMWPLTDAMFAYGHLIARHNQASVSLKRLTRLLMGSPDRTLVAAHLNYMDGTLPEVPEAIRTPADRLHNLQVRSLSYRYPENGRGISEVSFEVSPGTVTVITGRIGSGKTTLLRSFLGLLPADGEIYWNGQHVDDPQSFFVPPRAAYTGQVPRLFSEALRDNILMGQPKSNDDVHRALHTAVFDEDLDELEEGLGTIVGPRGVRLSGGQVQRTAAARMFVTESELLVFDDLSSALDVETEKTLWQRIFDPVRRDGRRSRLESPNGDIESAGSASLPTCLVVSHRRSVLQHADQVLVLKDGAVEALGKLDHLLENSAEMQRLWEGELNGDSP